MAACVASGAPTLSDGGIRGRFSDFSFAGATAAVVRHLAVGLHAKRQHMHQSVSHLQRRAQLTFKSVNVFLEWAIGGVLVRLGLVLKRGGLTN